MADSEIPSKLPHAIRLLLYSALPFIFVLIGIERFFDPKGNHYQVGACFVLALLSIVVSVYWDRLLPRRWRRTTDKVIQLQTWFERDYLELYELAYLSLGKRPQQGPMPDDVLHRHRKLKDAVHVNKLPAKNLNRDGNPNVMSRVHIDDFARFAKNDGNNDFITLAERWMSTRGKQTQPDDDLIRGFNHVASGLVTTKDAAINQLAALRTEGVRIRNAAQGIATVSGIERWSGDVVEWMNDVVEVIKPVNPADAEWFATLDTVPPARVAIPRIQFVVGLELEIFESTFRQHDYRLVRLENLLRKYGVGAAVNTP